MHVSSNLFYLAASPESYTPSLHDALPISFEVQVMPVAKEVTNGQTVEIRITIERSANFSDAKYFIRYFQFDGQGALRYYSEPPYMPNDLYLLPQTQFRLYYTSQSTVSHAFDIWISDNFGNEKQVSFQFNSRD